MHQNENGTWFENDGMWKTVRDGDESDRTTKINSKLVNFTDISPEGIKLRELESKKKAVEV